MATTALPRQVIVAGTNLFALAAKLYGDATLANILANANGLTDPFPAGPTTLTVPALNTSQSGGMPVS